MKDDLISRQAAIKAIENMQDCYNGFSDTYDKACIIGALEEVPSAQQDYDFSGYSDRLWKSAYERGKAEAQRTGLWVVNRDSTGCMYGRCTSCGMKQYAGRTKYCPNCGARMEGQE